MSSISILDRHYEKVIVGGSFDALILGLKLTTSGKKTLVLDSSSSDEMVLEPLFSSALEVEYLKQYGQYHHIEAFEKLGTFAKATELYVHNKEMSLRLGQSSYVNLLEIERKTNFFNGRILQLLSQTNPDEFQILVQKTFGKISLGMIHFQDLENINIDVLLTYLPDFIKKLFFIFKESLDNDEKKDYRHFLRSILTLYQKRLAREIKHIDLLYLFLCIIGPQKQLKHLELKEYLGEEFARVGGHLKRSNIRQWSLHHNKPWAIELESFDGVIHPDSLCYLDFRSIQFPLQMKSDFKTCLSIEKKGNHSLAYLSQGTHFFSRKEDLGSQIPGCVFFSNPSKMMIYFQGQPGLKIEFVEKQIFKYLRDLFSEWSLDEAQLLGILKGIQLNEADYLIDQTLSKKGSKNKKPILVDGSNPGGGNKLRSVSYDGLYPGSQFGRLSRFSRIFNGHLGQTSMEYILLLVVVVTMILSVLGLVREKFMASPEACIAGSTSLSCQISNKLKDFGTSSNGNEKFRYFKLYR